jgi:3-dehydroquinate dehydratase/shikimate dehydrogenase
MSHSLLVETVTGQTMTGLIAAREAARDVDLVELRLDGVADVDVRGALSGRRLPVIVTCRPTWEGGRFEGSEERRQAVLMEALDAGAEYVDVEWRAGFTAVAGKDPARVILSSHDFGGVPADLTARAAAMRQAGASLIKIAVTATRLSDALPLLDIARTGDAVVIAMGDAGVPSRLLATRFGSRWTYAGDAVALPDRFHRPACSTSSGFARSAPRPRSMASSATT